MFSCCKVTPTYDTPQRNSEKSASNKQLQSQAAKNWVLVLP